MPYLVYNLSYKGQQFDFVTRTKDHKQAIFDAVSTVFREMEITSRDCGHPSRYQLSTERDLVMMAAILPDIKLELVETITGDEEHHIDWALKLLVEYERIKNSGGMITGDDQDLEVEVSQSDFTMKRYLDRRFSNLYHHDTQKIKDECLSEMTDVLHRGWLLVKRIEALTGRVTAHGQS
ncbi:hypothetical protein D9M68_18830 [compost metagenome]